MKKIIMIGVPTKAFELLYKKMEFQILDTSSGIDGIRKIMRHRPDLVISEIDLPLFNGFSLVKTLELLKIDIPIIFTAKTTDLEQTALSFKNTKGFLLHDDILAKLPLLIETIHKRHKPEYHDYEYTLRQHEWADLMSPNDRKRIMLIEDARFMMTISLTTLDTDEFQLFSSNEGWTGFLKTILLNPDLILMDIDMPFVDGILIAQLLYVLGKPIPMVLLTNRDDQELVNITKNFKGIIGNFHKSILRNPPGFTETIRGLLEKAELWSQSSEKDYKNGSLRNLKNLENLGLLQDIHTL